MVIFLLRVLLAGAPEVGPAGLRPEMFSFLLRVLLPGAPEAAPAGLGPQMVTFLLRVLLAGAPFRALGAILGYLGAILSPFRGSCGNSGLPEPFWAPGAQIQGS